MSLEINLIFRFISHFCDFFLFLLIFLHSTGMRTSTLLFFFPLSSSGWRNCDVIRLVAEYENERKKKKKKKYF